MIKPLNCKQSKLRTQGFSLVELMVAMVLGLMLIGGVIQVFLSNKLMFDSSVGVARLQENARFVLAEIASDLRMAGYRGCNSNELELTNLIKIGGVANNFLGFDKSLSGYDAETNQWSYVDAASYATGTNVSTSADRLIIKNLGTELLHLSAPLETNATAITVVDVKGIDADDLLFIGNCEKGATVAVTGVSGTTIEFGSSENLTQDLTADKSRFVTADTLIHKLETKSYFIARSEAYTNNRGDRPWSLWRRVNNGTPQELAVGVENLQVLYGEDNDGDGVADMFVKASAAVNMEKVVVARIQIVTNGIDETADGLMSRAFSLTVHLRNRAAS